MNLAKYDNDEAQLWRLVRIRLTALCQALILDECL